VARAIAQVLEGHSAGTNGAVASAGAVIA
jgi:hypothetical protein